MSENEVNLKLLESITGSEVFKQILEAFAKLSFPNDNPYLNSRFGTYGDIYAEIKEVCRYFRVDF